MVFVEKRKGENNWTTVSSNRLRPINDFHSIFAQNPNVYNFEMPTLFCIDDGTAEKEDTIEAMRWMKW